MPRPRNPSTIQEKKMVRTLDNLRLYDELMPAIRACALANGGAEQVLKKSEVLAALQLTESLDSEKDDVRLRAAVEILNRTVGKPVERSFSIYGDIAKLNEKDIDNQILRAVQSSGAQKLIDAAASPAASTVKQSRKPRKSSPLGEQSQP